MSMAPYLRNVWYLAAWADEVPDDGFLARTFLDRPWLVYRLSDGDWAMIADRCPHRFAPLSKGRREGDLIICGYHGLGFAANGSCAHSSFAGELPKAHVATAPIVERHRGLWFWPGDPAQADEALIPDFSFLDADRGTRRSHLSMNGNYELVTDNLMDLSHAEFIHRDSFGVNGALFGGDHSVIADDDGAIWNNWDMADCDLPEWASTLVPEGTRAEQWLHMRWHAPACMALSIGLARAGSNRSDMIVPPMRNPHIVTPETQTRSHYFYDHEDSDEAANFARQVFVDEDEPMIEAVQESLGGQDFWDARSVILPSDAGAIRARRRLMQLRREEADNAA